MTLKLNSNALKSNSFYNLHADNEATILRAETYLQQFSSISEGRAENGEASSDVMDVMHDARQRRGQELHELRGHLGVVTLDEANDGGAGASKGWRQFVSFVDQGERHDAVEAPECPC